MAKRNPKPKARSSRGVPILGPSGKMPRSKHREPADTSMNPVSDAPILMAIENARARLGRARVVLNCLATELDFYNDNGSKCDLAGLAEVAEVASDLIVEALTRLDSTQLLPLLPGRELLRSQASKQRVSAA